MRVSDYLGMRADVAVSGAVARLCAVALVFLATGRLARADEVPLHEVYGSNGQYGIYHGGQGVVPTGGAATISGVGVSGRVERAYLYWVGCNWPHDDLVGDSVVTFTPSGMSGVPVTADDIVPVEFEKPSDPGSYFWNANHISFVADVTQLITPGIMEYAISDFAMDDPLGVGLQIVYEDDSLPAQDLTIYQGHDYAFRDWPDGGELNRTHVLAHTFDPADEDRQVEATFFLAGAFGTHRSARLWYASGEHDSASDLPVELITNGFGTVLDSAPLVGGDGNAWDTLTEMVTIPAGATYVSFQFESGDGTLGDWPESFSWVSTSIAMVPEPTTLSLLALGGASLLRRRRRR